MPVLSTSDERRKHITNTLQLSLDVANVRVTACRRNPAFKDLLPEIPTPVNVETTETWAYEIIKRLPKTGGYLSPDGKSATLASQEDALDAYEDALSDADGAEWPKLARKLAGYLEAGRVSEEDAASVRASVGALLRTIGKIVS